MKIEILIKGFFSKTSILKTFPQYRADLHKMTINKSYSYLRHYTLKANEEFVEDITSLCIVFVEIKKNNKIDLLIPVGWGLVDDSGEIGVFVQRDFRNLGLGSKISQKLLSNKKNNPKKIIARPWTDQGSCMYSKFNDRIRYA